jgi:hypothetical protein
MIRDFEAVRAAINWTMEPADPMFGGDMNHYSSVGESALKSIVGATPSWLIRTVMEAGCRVVAFSEHAWDGHQDVLAFQNAAV